MAKMRVARSGFRVAGCGLRAFTFWILDLGFWILSISDCGLAKSGEMIAAHERNSKNERAGLKFFRRGNVRCVVENESEKKAITIT